MKINKLIATSSLLAMLPMGAPAALITWSPSVDMYADGVGIDGDQSFVSTNGTGVLAVNGTDVTTQNPTVNGVAFTDVIATTLQAGYTDAGSGVTIQSDVLIGQTDNAFGDGGFSGDTDIFNLIAGGYFGANTITFGGLTIGNTYEIQVFSNDARTTGGRANNSTDWRTGFSDGTQSFADSLTAGTIGESSLNNRTPAPDLTGETSGDYIIGTFVATAATQSFETAGTSDGGTNWTDGGRSQINGIQLRQIAEVPEPSSAALLGLGGLALILRRRK
ncbi:PEP-CTERM sorting domain-containing protein [Verrucomicrobiaceae bacterium 5K15]|uniref:PEP-CTERM sorting domain-containing protein n=1 Tax=Oceaniferula flava TaxID=2800421 RepID=A0AAE2SBX4_9BACT|nr:PEP-CTERM sorting domain-containing protein [Oceaniferula flavus]MBK1853660.1 PEP-CTERM sorting domain-containing protein [Oceaniferula flavus]MBM1134965.1 PEP-CTERM sorting domain-containing protein [Oceaniferula flavus]